MVNMTLLSSSIALSMICRGSPSIALVYARVSILPPSASSICCLPCSCAHAQAEFLSAARTGAWATLYLAVGVVWWPAALVGAGAWLVAWRRGRDTMDRLAELVEATVDLHATALARALGRTIEGEFTPADGEWVTRRVRKGA